MVHLWQERVKVDKFCEDLSDAMGMHSDDGIIRKGDIFPNTALLTYPL